MEIKWCTQTPRRKCRPELRLRAADSLSERERGRACVCARAWLGTVNPPTSVWNVNKLLFSKPLSPSSLVLLPLVPSPPMSVHLLIRHVHADGTEQGVE